MKEGAAKVVDKAKSIGKDILKGGQKAVDVAENLVDGAEEQFGKATDSETGVIGGFVDSVRIH